VGFGDGGDGGGEEGEEDGGEDCWGDELVGFSFGSLGMFI
jgi:hypothetical protein